MAHSSFFDSIAVGRLDEEFVDGGSGTNNPGWGSETIDQTMYGPKPWKITWTG
ncbi:hypothetical protein LTR55_011541 [Exophiala xenobiotica]|nr:hypothetical protein LTR18_011148 [Exophiala xenobiotica]KAK5468920.1 hypothetical protein LTR55_011541 [Exophiala xenobiotica]